MVAKCGGDIAWRNRPALTQWHRFRAALPACRNLVLLALLAGCSPDAGQDAARHFELTPPVRIDSVSISPDDGTVAVKLTDARRAHTLWCGFDGRPDSIDGRTRHRCYARARSPSDRHCLLMVLGGKEERMLIDLLKACIDRTVPGRGRQLLLRAGLAGRERVDAKDGLEIAALRALIANVDQRRAALKLLDQGALESDSTARRQVGIREPVTIYRIEIQTQPDSALYVVVRTRENAGYEFRLPVNPNREPDLPMEFWWHSPPTQDDSLKYERHVVTLLTAALLATPMADELDVKPKAAAMAVDSMRGVLAGALQTRRQRLLKIEWEYE